MGSPRLLPYEKIEGPLRQLLIDFGPYRKSYHPELPFWHLYGDGFWEIRNIDIPRAGTGSTDISSRELFDAGAKGGLTEDYFKSLQDPRVASETIAELLNRNFPDSIHEDILQAVGIDPDVLTVAAGHRPQSRDPTFREAVLRAYEWQCAICGFLARIGQNLVGVEAAHIKWHQAGGPDTNPNGVALCSLHHKLFDRGIIGFTSDLRIVVSEAATGSAMFNHVVTDFHGRELSPPVRRAYRPDDGFVAWHVKEVFHPPARELGPA